MTTTETVIPFNNKIEQNQEEFSTSTTSSINPRSNDFSGKPFVEVRPIRSVAQISGKSANTAPKNYYLPSYSLNRWNSSLPSKPYQFRTLDEESQEIYTDNIEVGVLAKSVVGQNISFIPDSAQEKWGKFPPFLKSSPSKNIPRPRFDFRATGLNEDEQIWRGTFPLSHRAKILFSEEIEVKIDELPAWKPHIVIDSYRLEDDDE
ncbi:MAG: hypothetical protein SVX43_10545 [Cyanobacteriota bacterium]|nr:hypothetical protein [Cyanobacteriota bacterium]